MQRDELQDLEARRLFRTIRGSIEGKLFWTTRDDAERFARLLARDGIGPSRVVEARVAAVVQERLTSLSTDGRPARYIEQASLDWFNGLVMDLVMPRDEGLGELDG